MNTLSTHLPGLPEPLNHPCIGRVQGRYNKGVIQYLGLPYASLEHRFAASVVLEYPDSPKADVDATKHGYLQSPLDNLQDWLISSKTTSAVSIGRPRHGDGLHSAEPTHA